MQMMLTAPFVYASFFASSWAKIEGERARFVLWVGTFPKLEGKRSSPGPAQHGAFGGQVGPGIPGTAIVLRDGRP